MKLTCNSHICRVSYKDEFNKKDFRIRVGYVSANIKSKTTVYMAQVGIQDVIKRSVIPKAFLCIKKMENMNAWK